MTAPIYTSDRGLYPHQADGIAQWIVRQSMLCTWSAGCGKSHLSLAGGSMLFEDDKISLMLVVCEQNKVDEWRRDFETFTTLRTAVYMGTPKKREAIRGLIASKAPDAPQVLISTYETSRNDLGKFQKPKKGRKKFTEGPLVDVLVAQARIKGLAIVYDESVRLGNRYSAAMRTRHGWQPARGSVTYKAHLNLVEAIRHRAPKKRLWVAGMTATPIDRNPETVFNQAYLIAPHIAGSIKEWDKNYVRWQDQFGRCQFKNISPDDAHREPWVTPLSVKLAPLIHHKDKTDPDVRAAFPDHTEEPMYVNLSKAHKGFYDAIELLKHDRELFPRGMSERDEQVMFGLLRQVAAHPAALIHSPAALEDGSIANTILNTVGPETLLAMESAKTEALVHKLTSLVKDQGAQAVVFTFFGQSVLPLLEKALTEAGFTVAPYHGQMSAKAKDEARQGFRDGKFEILLSSNTGAQGLNLPEAQYVIHYELCLSYAKTLQRCERISRIGSGHSQVTSYSMVALGTIEETILSMNFRRQKWHEGLLAEAGEPGAGDDDGDKLDVETRRKLFADAKAAAV